MSGNHAAVSPAAAAPLVLREVLERLLAGESLAEAEAQQLLVQLTDESLSPAMVAAQLVALRAKGVVADEVRGFAKGMRALARRPELPEVGKTVDVVGTGGDGSGSVNLSTGAALLAAAAGAQVVIADPPRRGLDAALLDQLCAQPPERFLYVSCGLESFLSDAARLTAQGRLRLAQLTAFNLMPFTEHVETVARFERVIAPL